MKKALVTTCAVTVLTGLVALQSSTAQTQTPGSKAQKDSPSTSQPSSPSAQPQPGVRRVDAAALVMHFYTANAADFRASKLMGKSVYNLQNEEIGEVEDLIINDGKTIQAIVVSVGGFLGIGDRNVAISPASVALLEQADGSARLVVNTTKEDLKKAPAFNFADVDRPGPNAGKTTTTGSGSGSGKGSGSQK